MFSEAYSCGSHKLTLTRQSIQWFKVNAIFEDSPYNDQKIIRAEDSVGMKKKKKKRTDWSWNSILLREDDYILAFHATVASTGSHSSQEPQAVAQMIALLFFLSMYVFVCANYTGMKSDSTWADIFLFSVLLWWWSLPTWNMRQTEVGERRDLVYFVLLDE